MARAHSTRPCGLGTACRRVGTERAESTSRTSQQVSFEFVTKVSPSNSAVTAEVRALARPLVQFRDHAANRTPSLSKSTDILSIAGNIVQHTLESGPGGCVGQPTQAGLGALQICISKSESVKFLPSAKHTAAARMGMVDRRGRGRGPGRGPGGGGEAKWRPVSVRRANL